MKRARICTGFLGLFAAASWLCAGCGGDDFRAPAADSDETSGQGGSGQGSGSGEGGGEPGEGGATGGGTGQGGSDPSGDCDAGETRTCYSGPPGTETLGACLAGVETCDAGGSWGPCEGEVIPAAESCSTESDDDCDGEVNQGCACTPGASETCYSGPAGTQNVGACKAGSHTCDASGAGYGACAGEVLPAVEDCANPADEDCSGLACAQTMWSKIAGDASYQSIEDVAVDSAGNTYVTGSFEGTISLGGSPLISNGARDIFVAKFDAAGAHLWSKRYGDSSDQIVAGLAVNAGGTVALVGIYKGTFDLGGPALPSNTTGYATGFLAKLDSSGNHLLSKQVAKSTAPSAVAIDGGGRVAVAGSFTGCFKSGYMGLCSANSAGGADGFVISYSATGTWEWDRVFGNASDQYVNAIAFDPSGNLVLSSTYEGSMIVDGTSIANSGSSDVLIAKLDSAGKYAWKFRLGGPMTDDARDVVVDASGNAVVLAQYAGNFNLAGKSLVSKGDSDVLLVHISSGGVVTASETFGGASVDRASSLARDADGNLLIAGSTNGSIDFGGGPLGSAGDLDIVIAKLTATGAHIWSKRFGDASYQTSSAIAASPTKELIVAALVKGTVDFGTGGLTSAGGYDMALAKFAP